MFTRETLNAVRDVDIYDVVSSHVKLKKQGSNYAGYCPFHDEKMASFVVYKKSNTFKCFGCTKGGDGIKFLRELSALSFEEAVEAIAKDAGIAVEYEASFDREAYQQEQAENASLFTLLEQAQTHFLQSLKGNEEAQEYLHKRGWTEETIAQFGIGFAPEGNLLKKKLQSHDYPTAAKASILSFNEKKEQYFDFFQARITFPVHDARGQLVGFSGRNLTGEKPKYINSREGVYQKNRIFYGFHHAAAHIQKMSFAVLVEGNPDVISLHQASVTNTIAKSGTELTDYHVGLITRVTKKVCIIPDGDASGLKATEKDIQKLLRAGIETFVFEVPAKADGSKNDPDEWVRTLSENLS